MKMRELMRTAVVTITEPTSLGDATRLMMTHQIRHLPVVRGNRLVGILSERDILHYRALSSFKEDWQRVPVTTAMVATLQTAGPDDSLTEVAGRLASAHIGAMPIVELGALIGLVTVGDVLNAEVRAAMA